jgi:DNA-binding SARP family transcriptional activator
VDVLLQVLGSVRASRDGRELDLGPPGRRALLGLLVLARGRPLRRTELVDELWEREPPPSAINIIQTHVKHLRRVLDPDRQAYARSLSIPTIGDGYALRVPPDQVDVERFHALVRVAEEASRSGQRDQAAATLVEALRLWQGPPLSDLPAFSGHPAVLALVGARREAVLAYAKAMTTIGRAAEALPVVIEAAAAQPLDETIAAALVRVYAAAGQRARAFAVYDTTRRMLVAELGVDPGPDLAAAHATLVRKAPPPLAAKAGPDHLVPAELPADVAAFTGRTVELGVGPSRRHLHQQVLSTAPELTVGARAYRVSRAPVPRQLPAPPRLFTGRTRELGLLTSVLRERTGSGGAVLAVIGGAGGIGKTWLALHWAYQNRDLFPDGQLYVNLRGFDPTGEPMPPATAVRGFLDALGATPESIPQDLDAQIGLYRSLVATRRILIVLDNAGDTGQVTPLLPGGSRCAVLVTSRHRLDGLITAHGAQPVDVDVLTGAEARQLLTRQVGPDRVAAEPEAVRELLAYCAGLPLAIGIVAARAGHHPEFPLAILATELRDRTGRLAVLETADSSASLRAALSWSYHALSPAAAAAFGLLGLAPGADISLPAATSLLALPTTGALAVLRELEHAHLVQQHCPSRFRMHDLVRLYATHQAQQDLPEPTRAAATHRLVDFYLHTAHTGDRLLQPLLPPIKLTAPVTGSQPYPLADRATALAWFAAELPNLLAVHDLTPTRGRDAAGWQLAWLLTSYLYRQGRFHAALATWQTGKAAAERLNDPAMHNGSHQILGAIFAELGLHDEALRHLTQTEHSGDLAAQAYTHHALGWSWSLRGDDRRALRHATRSLCLYQALGIPAGETRELTVIGWYRARLGDFAEASGACDAALALARRHGHREDEALTLGILGFVAQHTSQPGQATDLFRQAHTMLHEVGNTYYEATVLDFLGETQLALDNLPAARTAFRQALELYQVQGRAADADRVRRQLEKTCSPAGRP